MIRNAATGWYELHRLAPEVLDLEAMKTYTEGFIEEYGFEPLTFEDIQDTADNGWPTGTSAYLAYRRPSEDHHLFPNLTEGRGGRPSSIFQRSLSHRGRPLPHLTEERVPLLHPYLIYHAGVHVRQELGRNPRGKPAGPGFMMFTITKNEFSRASLTHRGSVPRDTWDPYWMRAASAWERIGVFAKLDAEVVVAKRNYEHMAALKKLMPKEYLHSVEETPDYRDLTPYEMKEAFTRNHLRVLAREHDLKISGTKIEVSRRLYEHFRSEDA